MKAAVMGYCKIKSAPWLRLPSFHLRIGTTLFAELLISIAFLAIWDNMLQRFHIFYSHIQILLLQCAAFAGNSLT